MDFWLRLLLSLPRSVLHGTLQRLAGIYKLRLDHGAGVVRRLPILDLPYHDDFSPTLTGLSDTIAAGIYYRDKLGLHPSLLQYKGPHRVPKDSVLDPLLREDGFVRLKQLEANQLREDTLLELTLNQRIILPGSRPPSFRKAEEDRRRILRGVLCHHQRKPELVVDPHRVSTLLGHCQVTDDLGKQLFALAGDSVVSGNHFLTEMYPDTFPWSVPLYP